MIGRRDEHHQDNPYYVYIIGSDKLSHDLHDINELVNDELTNLELDYRYNDDADPNRFYYRSDHYNFAKNDVRSEEHTSELQSRGHLVCRLLLEKKKTT